MFYPERWLPTDLNSKVERAINAAECSLRESVRNGSKHDGPRLALEYINVVFPAFASQLCEAARQRHLTLRQVRKHVEGFLPQLFRHAFNLAKVEPVYGRHTLSRYHDFEKHANEKLRTSQIWIDHLKEREEVAPATPVSAAHDVQAGWPRRLSMLLEVWKEVPADALQKEITALIEEKLKVTKRDAQAYATLIRSDASASTDARTKWRKKKRIISTKPERNSEIDTSHGA